jgi:hypothetical protein
LRENVEDDALWVVEQVPTLVVGKDVTEILRTGYWPSYNVPFFEEVYCTIKRKVTWVAPRPSFYALRVVTPWLVREIARRWPFIEWM